MLENSKKNSCVKMYSQMYGAKIQKIGAISMRSEPWLLGSVDGVILDEKNLPFKVLEVKCAYSCRTKPIFDKDNNKCNVGYSIVENDIISLKESHVYNTQCQT